MEKTTNQNWNLESLFAGGIQSEKLKELITQLTETLHMLNNDLTTFQAVKGKKDLQKLLEIIHHFQYVLSGWAELDDFLICAYAQNVKDSEVIVLMDESAIIKAKLNSSQIDLDQTLADLTDDAWEEFTKLEELKSLLFYLEERRQTVKDRLPIEMERIISALSVNGISGWEQQHEQMLTQLKVAIEIGEEKKEVSIGQALNQAVYSKEQYIRQNAATAIKRACESNAELFASVLNRIAGFRLEVYEQRGWKNILKETLEQNRIKEETVHTMIASINQSKPLFKSYIQRKIKLDQIEQPSWFDLESPRFAPVEKISYPAAMDLIIKQFHHFSEKLGNFAEKAFEANWIETENRPGKAEGGFCASLPLSKESRIFLTYRENYQDVVTIAHELGHAYHNYILHEEPAFAQQKGTSVAETASTFMENLVLDAMIHQTTNEKEKLALLEMKITNGIKYVGTVPNMFRFEQEFYERRKKGLLTVEEINTLISEVENDLYDGLIDELAVYKWMYISHFYDAEKAFYNIPYTTGYLFSNGIYALAKEKGEGFEEQYDELLRNSGKMTVEKLAKQYLGQDLTKVDFWDASLQTLIDAIEEYLSLTEKYCS